MSKLHSVAKIITRTLVVFLFLEITLRIGAFFSYGYSKYYLFYGFPGLLGRVGVSPWSTSTGGYYKFPANYVLQGAVGQSSETASINSLGFRGPEFQPIKSEGIFRIICLGESSTFGYRNSDAVTYPFLLEQLFRQHPKPSKVEVINAGFPYYNTGSILSLLESELLQYKPDLLTLYSAYNDAGWPLEVGVVTKLLFWIQQHSATYLLLKENILTDQFIHQVLRTKIFRKLNPPSLDLTEFDNYLDQISVRYRQNISAIVARAKREGIPIILIRQPMTTSNELYRSVPYEQEYREVLSKFHKQKGRVRPGELQLIKQRRLVKELEKIAEEQNIPMIDNVAIVDQDRRRLASYVHLTEEGNLRLAEALRSMIEPYLFQKQASSP